MKNIRRNMMKESVRHKNRRILAVILSICMLLTICPAQVQVQAAVTASPGTITSNQEWGAQTLAAGTYTINSGVTVTVSGKLTVNGNVTIKGGGKLVRQSSYKGSGTASESCIFYVSGGTLTLENITVDGNSVEAYGAAVYINSGTVNMKTGAVIQNNVNMNTGTTGVSAAGGVYCGNGGTLNIDGGTIKNCRTSETVGSSVYTHAGGGVYLKGTCNMTAGNITGNKASNGGGIYLASTDAVLRLSGGVISGNSAAGDGDGIFYSTVNDATSKLYIGGMANIKDIIYLDNRNGTLYPYITSIIRYPVTLSCNSTEEGRVLAGGDGYTLTSVDASKISMTGTTLYSRLDKANNQIYLSVTEEPEAMWQESAGGAWKQGRFTTALENVYNGGTIKLLTAIVITQKAEITKAVTITSNNASDPCIMTRMPSGNYGNITITGSGHLTLTNIIYDGNRDWIQGTEKAKEQSLIKVGDGASDTGACLTLGDGAVVRDGYKEGGSGLFAVYGTMVMNNGAVIDNCEVTGTGGGIWVHANGKFTMNGGTIRGCKAGGGGSAISTDGTCTLKGGSITGNTDASDKKCAVYLRSSGSGNLIINGTTIADNEYSVYNEGKSVFVAGDSTLSGSIYTTNAITASDKAVSSLTKTYAIMWPADSLTLGTVVVKGSKDTQHYQLANTGYGLSPASDGSSNLIIAQRYKVSFNTNGGSGTVSDIEVICGGVYGQLPTPTRTGHTFGGWYTAATGGSQVTAQTVVTATAAHTLYAHWTANTYTITYNKNSGTITNESNYTSYTYGKGLTLPTPARTGYTFGGWYTSSSLSGTAVTSISTTETGNKTYYAKWTANTYTITYNKNSGTIASESNYTSYTYGKGLTLPTPTRTGYTFGGWYTSSSFSGTKVTSISTAETGNKTYYAKWTDDIAPVIGTLSYNYQPKNLWQWLIGRESLVITVPVTEKGSGADEITYTVTPQDGMASEQTSELTKSVAKITVPADFKGTIVITCTDKAGNQSADMTVGVAGIIIEDNAPQVAFWVNGSDVSTVQYETAPAVTVTVTDDKDDVISGGIASVVYQIGDNAEVVVPQDFAARMETNATFTIPAEQIPEGETVITVKAVDNAGNTVTATQSISVKTDEEKAEEARKEAEEKVEAAKTVVEETLAGITVANDVTKDSIQEAVDAALSNAGITGVTVTVSSFDKTDAADFVPGSFSANISIASSSVSGVTGSVPVIMDIPQLHKHTYTWLITKEATADGAGEMTGTCTCKEVTTVTIPKTGDGGSGTVVVKEDTENECKGILTDKTDVKGKVALTDIEKEQINAGEDLVIILKLKDENVAADTQEKTEIQKELGTNTLGTFLDIELLKQIGGTETKITGTTDKIAITFEIPEHVRNTDSNVARTYQIMRNHDGMVEILDVESYDEATHLLTFMTDKFSTYALVYQDVLKNPGDPVISITQEPITTEPVTISEEMEKQNALFLNIKLKVSQTGKKINVAWGKVTEADGYDVYVQYCGKKFTEKSINAIEGAGTTKATVEKVNGKPLNLKKDYKIYILAYKIVDGKKVTLGKSVIAHIVGRKNTKYTNVKAVKVKKKSYSLTEGKTAKIKASTVLVSKGKKQLTDAHAEEFRYETSDKTVATVSKKGKIKAVGEGSCTIYVYARNGYTKKIEVTVNK